MQLKSSTLAGGSALDFHLARLLVCLTGCVLVVSPARSYSQTDDASPFVITPAITTDAGGPLLSLTFHVPEHH